MKSPKEASVQWAFSNTFLSINTLSCKQAGRLQALSLIVELTLRAPCSGGAFASLSHERKRHAFRHLHRQSPRKRMSFIVCVLGHNLLSKGLGALVSLFIKWA